MSLIVPRLAARTQAPPLRQWWARAWQRSVEENRYDDADWKRARALARSGRLSSIGIAPGVATAVVEGADAAQPTIRVDVLPAEQLRIFADLARATVGRLSGLLSGVLDLALVEECEELGVELIGSFGGLAAECTCNAWQSHCRHALALALQLGWVMDTDPWTLLTLRGITRADLAPGHGGVSRPGGAASGDPALGTPAATSDLEAATEADELTALEAIFRARRLLAELATAAEAG